MAKRTWIWISLFVWTVTVLGTLAFGWNAVLVDEYRQLVELARRVTLPAGIQIHDTRILVTMIAGSLGFLGILIPVVFFLIRLLKEMRINQLQSEFLATVSHELKTPIAAIELSSSLIRNGDLSEEETQNLWKSQASEIKRLREEVENLLETARWTRPVKIQRTELTLESWISSALERWKILLGPDAELKREGDELDLQAELDTKALNLITDNLLDNAKKFAKGRPEVTVRTQKLHPKPFSRSPRWKIEIVDRGWGFSPNDSKKIFARFFRAKTAAPYAIPGTGLGLHLAQSACQALGLKLQGQSPGAGKGAIFTLEGKAR